MPVDSADADRWWWLDDLARDVRHALRSWQRKPAFASLCILTLAIGIGSVTAVFSIVAAVLVRPLPYAQPSRLVAVWDRHVSDRNLATIFASYADFDTWRRKTASLGSGTTWPPTTRARRTSTPGGARAGRSNRSPPSPGRSAIRR